MPLLIQSRRREETRQKREGGLKVGGGGRGEVGLITVFHHCIILAKILHIMYASFLPYPLFGPIKIEGSVS